MSVQDATFLHVLNHTDEPVRVDVPRGVDLLTGHGVGGTLELAPLGVAVVRTGR